MVKPTITLLRALARHPVRIAFICGVCWREVKKWIRGTWDEPRLEERDWVDKQLDDPEFRKLFLAEITRQHEHAVRYAVDLETKRLRAALAFALKHCSFFVNGTKTCDSDWHDETHSFHSTCPSCGGPVDTTPHVSNRRRVVEYTAVSERVREMLAGTLETEETEENEG